MQKTSIHPELIQPLFEAAANAADKGQSQFFTPLELGRALAQALPRVRPALVDLNCGAGHLLHASVVADRQVPKTTRLFGADLDPCRGQTVEGATLPLNRITCEITRLLPWLKEVNFRADCFVLNPPWRLMLYRERLAELANSDLPAVRMAFKGIEDTAPKGTIDSTIAMLLIALDLCTTYGEGFLIGNNATLQRLLFAAGAPHSAIAKHIWAHLIVPGNPMTGLENCQWQEDQQFHTGVLYFARDHTTGPKQYLWPNLPERIYRQGAELRNEYSAAVNSTMELWQAVRERVHDADGLKPKVPWNLWLAGGTIHTALSLFEKHSREINKREVERLHALDGQAPMELVLQRATRDELLRVAKESRWRVQPELVAAVDNAVKEYHAQRVPLYPLPEIQRLGYLDEEDTIHCKADLTAAGGRLVFEKGQSYPLRTQSVPITRSVVRPNSLTGEDEDLEYSGQELAFFIKRGDTEYCFMEGRLKNDRHTEIPNCKQVKGNQGSKDGGPPPGPVDFTLEELCSHFTIPEVPDVATVNPELYRDALGRLDSLISFLNAV
jgi:hypothetical protein